MSAADRRRLTAATLITVAALPALWLMQRDSKAPGSAGVAAANPNGGIVISGGDDGSDSETTIEITTTSTTTTVPSGGLALVPGGTTGATAATVADSTQHLTGDATYKRLNGYGVANACAAPSAPLNYTITVRSLNTGRETTCANVLYQPLATGLIIIVNTDTFLEIADTVDAPLPVEISW
jgi:hypothetical protein